jgi:hypothetical protein
VQVQGDESWARAMRGESISTQHRSGAGGGARLLAPPPRRYHRNRALPLSESGVERRGSGWAGGGDPCASGGVRCGADQISDEDGSAVQLDNEEEELRRKHELNQ